MIDLTKVKDEDLRREWARRNSAKRKTHGHRPKVLRACSRGCGAVLGAREMRAHRCNGAVSGASAPCASS